MKESWHGTQLEKTVTTGPYLLLKMRTDLHEPAVCLKKAGGQPGHEWKTLEITDTPNEIVEHRAFFCQECGKNVSDMPSMSGQFKILSATENFANLRSIIVPP